MIPQSIPDILPEIEDEGENIRYLDGVTLPGVATFPLVFVDFPEGFICWFCSPQLEYELFSPSEGTFRETQRTEKHTPKRFRGLT